LAVPRRTACGEEQGQGEMIRYVDVADVMLVFIMPKTQTTGIECRQERLAKSIAELQKAIRIVVA